MLYLFVNSRSYIMKECNQTIIASSIMVVEFVACYEVTNHRILLWNIIIGLHIIEIVKILLKIIMIISQQCYIPTTT